MLWHTTPPRLIGRPLLYTIPSTSTLQCVGQIRPYALITQNVYLQTDLHGNNDLCTYFVPTRRSVRCSAGQEDQSVRGVHILRIHTSYTTFIRTKTRHCRFLERWEKLGDGSLDGVGDVLLRRIGVVTVVQEDLQVGTFGGVTLPTNHMRPHQANNIQSGCFRSQFKSSQVSHFISSQS